MDFNQIKLQVAQNKKKRMTFFIVLLILFSLFTIGFVFLSSQNKISLKELQLSQVELGNFAVKVIANGQFKSRTPSLVTVKQAGIIQNILVEQGQFVEAGTPLITLINDNLLFKRSQLQTRLHNSQLEYELKNARLALERVQQEAEVARLAGESDVLEAKYLAQKQLAEEAIVSTLDLMATQVNWQNVERQHKLAAKILESMTQLHQKENILALSTITDVENEIDALNRDISELKVLASETGQVQKINVQLGENLSIGTPVIELSKNDDLQFVAQVPEREAQRIRNFSPANIRVDNMWLEGQVVRVSPTVDNGFVSVFINFNTKDDLLLRQDLSARVEITTDVFKDALFSDRRVANTEHGTESIWVFEPNSQTLIKRTVHLGAISQQQIAINAGVKAGELLVSFEQSKQWKNTAPTVVP